MKRESRLNLMEERYKDLDKQVKDILKEKK